MVWQLFKCNVGNVSIRDYFIRFQLKITYTYWTNQKIPNAMLKKKKMALLSLSAVPYQMIAAVLVAFDVDCMLIFHP